MASESRNLQTQCCGCSLPTAYESRPMAGPIRRHRSWWRYEPYCLGRPLLWVLPQCLCLEMDADAMSASKSIGRERADTKQTRSRHEQTGEQTRSGQGE